MKTINLLPKLRQEELRYESILKRVFKVIWMFVFVVFIVFASQLAARIVLQRESGQIVSKIETLKRQVNKESNTQIRAKIKTINDTVADYKNLIDISPKWSKVLEAFALLPPEEVSIESLSVDLPKKSITISGFSPTREKVIELYDIINQDKEHFYNIDYPLQHIVKPTNVNFQFTFYIQDSFLNAK
jgi:Tfp pilus assembly protein PilN